MCQTLNEEIGGPRQVLQTEGFIAYCPWAPSYPYEFWISPKKHSTSFSKITQKEINDLSLILRATLGGLTKTVLSIEEHTKKKKEAYDMVEDELHGIILDLLQVTYEKQVNDIVDTILKK